MDRRTFILLSLAVTATVVFGSAALAGGGRPWPYQPDPRAVELADPEGWISEPDFDGRTAVWIEVGAGSSLPRPAYLVIRRGDRSGLEQVRLDVPQIRESDPLDWLTGGPRVSGDTVVFSTRVTLAGTPPVHKLYAFDLPSRSLRELLTGTDAHVIRDPAIHGNTVVWADGRSGDLDIWSMDLAGGSAAPVVAPEPGGQHSPLISGTWVVWLSGDAAGGGGEVRAVHRAGRQKRTLNPGRVATKLALHGSRVAWNEADAGDLWAYLYDLDRGEGGPLAVLSPRIDPVELRFGGIDLADDWIVQSEGAADGPRGSSGRQDDGMPGHLLVYDAQAITSFDNLRTYLEPYTVAGTSAGLVAPVIEDFTVLWAEPDRDGTVHGGDRHLMRLLLARCTIYLPISGG